jgi:hypothetical protein
MKKKQIWPILVKLRIQLARRAPKRAGHGQKSVDGDADMARRRGRAAVFTAM